MPPPTPGHPPSGPGRCAPPSSSSAAGGCRCQISCSAGCTRGCPARVCCRDRDRTLSPRPLSIPHDAPKFNPGCPIPTPHSQPALAGARLGPPRLQTDFCGTASLALGNPKNKVLFSLLPLHPPKSHARPSRRDGAGSGCGGARRAWTCLPTRGKQSVDLRMLWLTAGPGRAPEQGTTAWSHHTHRHGKPHQSGTHIARFLCRLRGRMSRFSPGWHGRAMGTVPRGCGRLQAGRSCNGRMKWGGGWEKHPQRLTMLQGTGTRGPIGTWPPVPCPAPRPGWGERARGEGAAGSLARSQLHRQQCTHGAGILSTPAWSCLPPCPAKANGQQVTAAQAGLQSSRARPAPQGGFWHFQHPLCCGKMWKEKIGDKRALCPRAFSKVLWGPREIRQCLPALAPGETLARDCPASCPGCRSLPKRQEVHPFGKCPPSWLNPSYSWVLPGSPKPPTAEVCCREMLLYTWLVNSLHPCCVQTHTCTRVHMHTRAHTCTGLLGSTRAQHRWE